MPPVFSDVEKYATPIRGFVHGRQKAVQPVFREGPRRSGSYFGGGNWCFPRDSAREDAAALGPQKNYSWTVAAMGQTRTITITLGETEGSGGTVVASDFCKR